MSGNGQVTQQFFNTTAPLVVEARDGNGNVMANLPVTWVVTNGQGTIVSPQERTDAQGRASAYFRGDVTPGYTFSQQNIQVSSTVGAVNFVMTANINRLPSGSTAEYPLVELLSPTPEDRSLTGRSGGTIRGAIRVSVVAQSGPQSGVPIPNIGFRIVDAQDPSAATVAACVGQPMTDTQGLASCDLTLTGAPGIYLIAAQVGEFRITPGIFLKILSGAACSYGATASSQQFGAGAGIGSVNVTVASGCDWTAVSNANWITITSGFNGNGSGGATFAVSANTGASRLGSMTVGGQVITINQAGTGGPATGAVQIATGASLPSGVVGSAYNAVLGATGGRPPYIWIANTVLPPGLTLNTNTGIISGTPTTAGTFTTPITVTDQAGVGQTQTFSVTVAASGGQPGPGPGGANPTFAITGFPNGTVGVVYTLVLSGVGGCLSPFSAPAVFSLSSGTLPPGVTVRAVTDRTWAVTGTPAAPGTFSFTLTITDPCGKTSSSNFVMTVVSGTSSAGSLSVNPQSLSFTLSSGTAGLLQTLPLTVNGPAGTPYFAVTTVSGGGNWLSVTPSSDVLPANLSVRAAGTGALPNGNYTGTVTVTSNAGSISIPVTLTVGTGGGVTPPPATASLTVAPSAINYSVQAGALAAPQAITVASGSGAVRYSVQTSTVNGGGWLTVNQTLGDTPGNMTAILNPNGLAPSLYSGNIVITPVSPSGASQTIPVTLRVLPPAALAVSPGTLLFVNQPGAAAPAGQTLTIQSTGAPFDGTVSATTASGGSWLFVTPQQGTTPISAAVSVTAAGLPAGTYHGSVLITPSTTGVTPVALPVTLTVLEVGPVIASVTNAASFAIGPVAPGEIVTIFGSEMGPSVLTNARVNQAGRLESTVADTRVYFDEIAAPLVYSAANQVSAIVPYGIGGRATTKVSVEYRGIRSTPVEMRVAESAPAIFTASATGQAAAFNQDGSVNGTQNGAEPGSIVVLYATGEGQTDPGGSDGKLANDVYPKPVLQVKVFINGVLATLTYAGAAPTLTAGVMQINAVAPRSTPRGVSVPVVLQIGQASSPGGVTIAIRP